MSWVDLPMVAAVGLGVLTSISPCPMASHAAAISVLVRQAGTVRRGVLAGSAFALGRSVAYVLVAWIASAGLLALGPLVRRIQAHEQTVLGVVFLVGGVLLALSPRFKSIGSGIDAGAWKDRLAPAGALPGAFGLGFVLAMAFCPVSAGIFFGSVIPLASVTRPSFLVTVPYGLATALPVFALTIAAGYGTTRIARLFNLTQQATPWLHRASVVGMIGAGGWMLARGVG